MKKKIVGYLAVLVTSFAILLACNTVYAERYSVDQLRQMYPTGMQWNDGYNGGSECAGFAMLIYAKIYGVNGPQNSEVIYDVEQVEPGDIVRYNGHSVFILSRNGENVTVVECNYDYNNHVRWDQPKTMSELRNKFSFVIKGMYKLGSEKNPTSPTNAKVDTSFGVKVSWNRAKYNYGYKLFIYNESNEFVKEQLVRKTTTTTANIYDLATGNYTVKIYAIGRDDILSSNYTSVSFHVEQEAKLTYRPNQKKIIRVGETDKIYYSVSEGIAEIKLTGLSTTDNSVISYDSENISVTGLIPGKTEVLFEFKTSKEHFSIPITIEVATPIVLAESNVKINEGDTYKLNVTGSPTGEKISFYSRDKNVVTVDSAGNITAVAAGTTTIGISQTVYNDDKSDYTILSAECEVTVSKVIPNNHRISLNYSNYQIKYVNGRVTLKDEYLYGNQIKWYSDNEKIATVDSNGVVTAKNGGFATIRAVTSDYGSARCVIYVSVLRQMSNGAWAYPGDLNQDGTLNSIDGAIISDWYSRVLTEDEVALADIDGNGVVNSNDVAVLSDIYNQNISFIPGSYTHITRVTLSDTNIILDEGKSKILSVTVTPTNTTDSKKITWSSTNPSVVKVDSNGKITAVGVGSAYIIAKSVNDRISRCYVVVNEVKGELLYNSATKRWEYYKNGKPDYTYNGYATNKNGTYYVQKGIVTLKYNDLVMYNGKWTAIVNSKVNTTYTGISTNSNGTYYLEKGTLTFKYNGIYKDSTGNIYVIKNSKVDTTVNGLKYVNNGWYYFKKGKTDLTYSGIAKNDSNVLYYVDKGRITFNHNEAIKYNNNWVAIVNSKLNTTYTGMLSNKSGNWLFNKGKINFNYSGTYKDSNGVYYEIKLGKVDTSITTLKCNNGKWYYIKNGKAVLNYTGVASNSNGTYYLEKGNLTFKYNGTYKDSTGNIYVIKNSKVDTTVTGLKYVNNGWYYFKKGKTDFTYNGYATNKNGTYYVQKGIVTLKYNDLVMYNGKWTAIVNSKVNTSYTGLSTNKNGTYYLEKGKLTFKYNGNYTDKNGKTYTIKNSKVVY